MIVCADDYGLSDDIDRAILELCNLGKLSAVSCMVGLERCDVSLLDALLAHHSKVDIGLHLCLTNEGMALAPALPQSNLPEFKPLVLSAILGRINRHDISRLIASQYELFVEKCGRHPDHIDGHLHVHQLPTVRRALTDFVANLPLKHRPYIRNTWMPVRALRRQRLPTLKAAWIGFFGRRMQGLLQAKGLRTNQGFAGIYDFSHFRHYRDYLPRFVNCLTEPNGMLVVHPGLNEEWRRCEFQCLRDFDRLGKNVNRFQSSPN